ncbi:hypothetical protein YC2023_025687 [Brassica napus]
MQHIPQRIHELQEGVSVRPIIINQKTIALNVTLDCPIFPVHSLSPQKYRNLLRLAILPTHLPEHKNNIQYFAGKLILRSTPATIFYFNKSIDYIKHFKRRIRDYAKTCSTE